MNFALDRHRNDGRPGAAGDGLGGGGEQERVPTVGRAVGRQLLEVPVLALGHAHLDQVDRVHRERHRALEVDVLERRVVGGDRRDVVVVEPVDALRATAPRWSTRSPPDRRRGTATSRPVRSSTTSPGSTVTPRHLAGGVEVGAGERRARLHHVDPLEPGDVEQHAARHDRLHQADPALAPRRPR